MTVRRLTQRPRLARLLARGVLTARGRHGDTLPDTAYERTEVAIDRVNLSNYSDVCGFRQSDFLPPTYPHLLGFPAAVTLMVDPAFPFALPGLVHVNNRIQQTRPLRADERLTIGVHAADLRDHPRGRQFDLITDVTVDGQVVWTESSTYFRRTKSPSPSVGGPVGGTSPSPLPGEGRAGGLMTPTALWRIPRNIGRRYAAVSGDVNPIHLNPLVARLFGFKRAIAHGMWLKARCLAALEGRLPGALIVEVEFKSPLLLPSTVAYSATSTDGTWLIGVVQARTGRPHLTGRVGNTG